MNLEELKAAIRNEPDPFRRWLLAVKDAKPELVKSYTRWSAANPNIFKTFMSLSRQMAAQGRTNYSGWTIVNKMRWDHDIGTTGDVFKIRNALLVRQAIAKTPELFIFGYNMKSVVFAVYPPLTAPRLRLCRSRTGGAKNVWPIKGFRWKTSRG
jgi:hypothetical protein